MPVSARLYGLAGICIQKLWADFPLGASISNLCEVLWYLIYTTCFKSIPFLGCSLILAPTDFAQKAFLDFPHDVFTRWQQDMMKRNKSVFAEIMTAAQHDHIRLQIQQRLYLGLLWYVLEIAVFLTRLVG